MLIGDTTDKKAVLSFRRHTNEKLSRHGCNQSNFRENVRVKGAITPADVSLVRSDVGHTLP